MSESSTDFPSDSDISPLDIDSPSSNLSIDQYEHCFKSESEYDLLTTTEDEDFIDDTELSDDGSSPYVPTDQSRRASLESGVQEEQHREEGDGEEDEE
jgi:hypothetical protein